MGKFNPSKYQKAIFEFIKNGKGNAVISATAGSGKTSTLIESLKIIPEDKKVLFMAFNKSICNELQERVPKTGNITVMTVHGFGYQTLRNLNPQIEIDNYKYHKLLRHCMEYLQNHTKESIKEYAFDKEHLEYIVRMGSVVTNDEINIKQFTGDVRSLCNLGRLNFIDTEVKNVGIEQLDSIADKHVIDNEDGQSEVAWYLIKLGAFYKKVIDFTDMIFLPNFMDLKTEQYDFVYVDEAQDLSNVQRYLMLRTIKSHTGRFCAVGDEKQCIYSFAGANELSFNELCNLPNTIQLPLSITYRCHKQIVDRVKHINPDISHHKDNINGVVHEEFSIKDVKDGDMILCRNTFPVVSLCIKFLKEGKKAYLIGSDVGLSLINMIEDCERKREEYIMENVYSRLYDNLAKMIEKTVNNHGITEEEAREDSHIILYEEKISVIEALSEGITNPNEVIDKIKVLFSDTKKAGICLSNIHKSKGLEAERVFILHPELMPSKYAREPWELQQERNLRYVAYTRAKTVLGFITDYDAFAQHESQRNNVKPLVESKHVGRPGMKMNLELKVVSKRDVKGQFGDTVVYEMVDKDGNVFSKFGEISTTYISNGSERVVDVNSMVSFYSVIKEHSEFRGTKITKLGKISHY